MGAPLTKLERAFVAYLISGGAGTADDTHPGKNAKNKTIPCTIVYASAAEEIPPSSNEWDGTLTITRKSAVVEDEAVDNIAFDAIFDAVKQSAMNDPAALCNAVNAAAAAVAAADETSDLASFALLGVSGREVSAEANEAGDIWEDSITLKVHFAAFQA